MTRKTNARTDGESAGRRTSKAIHEVAEGAAVGKRPPPMRPTEARREAFRILRDAGRSMRRSVHEVERLLRLAEGGPL